MNPYIKIKQNKLISMLAFLSVMLRAEIIYAQGRINFGQFQPDSSIQVRKLGPLELNFNTRNRVILQESFGHVRIGLDDPELVVYEIEAPKQMDILISYEWTPLRRIGSPAPYNNLTPSLLLNIRAAYSNRGATSLAQALSQVVELPPHASSVVLPVLRSHVSSPPGLPPAPSSESIAADRAKLYFFVFGEILPWMGRISAGRYTGQVYISFGYPG
jgi:hypothetical protein